MKLNSPVIHKKARIEIIPLIDIMFFLLASFMLVSLSMIRMKGVKMTLPQAATASTETKPDFIPISINPAGEIFLGQGKSANHRGRTDAENPAAVGEGQGLAHLHQCRP